jgi:hypothetical protein
LIKRIAIILAGIMLMGLTACANYQTATDQQAVHEEGGPLTNPKVINCKEPGDKGRDQWFGENFYYYPAGPRTWLFDGSGNADSGAYPVYVKSPTVGGEKGQSISLPMPGEATMTLTRDCELLSQFHQEQGRKYQAYTEESGVSQTSAGWTEFLNAKFAPALQNGLNLALTDYTYDEVVADPALRSKIQDEVAQDTLETLNRSLGEDYFTSVTVTLFQPVLPETIQKAIDQNEAAKQFNTKVETELATMKQLVEILGPNGYIFYKALQDGDISVLPVPQGSGVAVPQAK